MNENAISALDDRYRRYVDLLVRHHDLLCDDAPDDALDPIECEMTNVWDKLVPSQQHSLSGLSSDLNWLRRGGQLAPKGRSAEEVTAEDLHELSQARGRGDWRQVLHHLRPCAAKLPPFEVAFLRATAWQAIGLPEIARMFGGLAVQLDPTNGRLSKSPIPIEARIGAPDRANAVD